MFNIPLKYYNIRYRWIERIVIGEPPCEIQMRRNVGCFLIGDRMIVTGGTYLDRIYIFDFSSRQWTKQKTKPPDELQSTWNYGGACAWKDCLYAYGSSRRISEEPPIEVKFLKYSINNNLANAIIALIFWINQIIKFRTAKLLKK